MLEIPLVEESATLIRGRLAEGHSVRYLVPEPVYRYIADRGLYRAKQGGRDRTDHLTV